MADSSHSFKALRDAQQSARQLIIEGALWLVYELPPVTLDRRSSPSLVFESETARNAAFDSALTGSSRGARI